MDRFKSQDEQPYVQPANAVLDPRVEPGEKIGKYEVINEIGRGGMSIVYKARDHELNRLVAIKVMLKQSADDTLNLLRFQQEARAASKLNHPNIVELHDFNTTDDGTPYLVMSYLNGVSLADAIKNEGSFSLGRWLSVMIQACDALDHAHTAGIVHRDIKPSNFVLAQEHGNEVLKLVDFGIAKHSLDDMSLTKTGELFGSPLYMSPEQCAGARLDSRSDIYSLGCVMYEALAGTPPIAGDNALSTLQKHLTDKPEPLTTLNLKTQKINQLDRIVMHCLEKKPDDRYQDLSELKHELRLLLQGQSLPGAKQRKNIALAVGAVILCVLSSASFLYLGRQSSLRNMPANPSLGSDTTPKQSVATNQTDAEKRTELEKLNLVYQESVKNGDYATAAAKSKRIATLAAELKFPQFSQAQIHLQQAYCQERLEHFFNASVHYEEALTLMADPVTPADYEEKYKAITRYAENLQNSNAFHRASEIFAEADALAKKMGNIEHQAASLLHEAINENRARESEAFAKHYKQAHDLASGNASLEKELTDIERTQKEHDDARQQKQNREIQTLDELEKAKAAREKLEQSKSGSESMH